jgi:hypothetical protein
MARNQDDGQRGIQRLQTSQQLSPIHAGHAQVCDNDAGKIGADLDQGGFGGSEGVNGQILKLEPFDQSRAEIIVVFDQGDSVEAREIMRSSS